MYRPNDKDPRNEKRQLGSGRVDRAGDFSAIAPWKRYKNEGKTLLQSQVFTVRAILMRYKAHFQNVSYISGESGFYRRKQAVYQAQIYVKANCIFSQSTQVPDFSGLSLLRSLQSETSLVQIKLSLTVYCAGPMVSSCHPAEHNMRWIKPLVVTNTCFRRTNTHT